jgi:hypothetical protein
MTAEAESNRVLLLMLSMLAEVGSPKLIDSAETSLCAGGKRACLSSHQILYDNASRIV